MVSVIENNVFFKKSLHKNKVNERKRSDYINWFKGYCKLYLLSNFRFHEINQININLFGCDLSSENDLINIINEIEINDLIKLILEQEEIL